MEVDQGDMLPAGFAWADPTRVARHGNQFEESVDMMNVEWIQEGWRVHSFHTMKVNQNWCACVNWFIHRTTGKVDWFNHEIWREATPAIWPTGVKYDFTQPSTIIFTWYRKPVGRGGVTLPTGDSAGAPDESADGGDQNGADPGNSADAMDTGDSISSAAPNVDVPPPPLPPRTFLGRTVDKSPEKRRCLPQ